MILTKLHPLAALLLLTISAIGCADMRDLLALRSELAERYHHDDIKVQLQNGETLSISFVNSTLGNLGQTEQTAKARDIASFVKQRYPSFAKIERVSISFVEKEDFVVANSSSVETFDFDKADL